jgi:tetratricopeptide (TPR) repeat protein
MHRRILQTTRNIFADYGTVSMKSIFLIALLISTSLSLVAQAPAPKPAAPAAPAAPAGAPLSLEDEVKQLLADAQAAFGQQKFDVALQKLGALHTKFNADHPGVMFLEGACHFNLKQYAEAIKFFEDFIKKFPDSEGVNDAKMAVGESYLLAGQPDKGIEVLKQLAAEAEEYFDKAGLMIASFYKKEGKPDDAIPILEKLVSGVSGAPTSEQQSAILMASDIYLGKNETEKAQAVMEKLNAGANADDTVVQRNIMAQKIGDEMLEAKRYGEALRAYQNVRRQSELLRIQKNRLARIEQWIAQLSTPGGGRVMYMGRPLSKDEAVAMLEQNKKTLAEIEEVKDYDAGLIYRLGQCFYEMQRYYEAMLAFSKIYTDYADYKDRDRCLFGMIVCNAALKRSSRAMALAEKYMAQFPEGSNYGMVTDMLASLAVESGDSAKARSIIQIALQQKDADKERLNFLLGVISFEMQDFDQARGAMQEVLNLNKDSGFKDSAMYYIALSYFFQNNSVKFLEATDAYLAANPKGEYLVDAKYRKAFIKVQAGKTGQKGGDVQGAREILEGLAKDYPNDANIGQVWSLLGDIYSEMSDPNGQIDYQAKTLEAYRNAVNKAQTADVRNYAIDAAQGLMQEKQMWPEIIEMWTTYYVANAGKPEALKAIHYTAIARERLANQLSKEGKFDEAKKQREDARALVAKEMLPHLGNPANEQVEVLIQQLVTMMVPKKRPRARPVEPAPAPAAPATPPAPAANSAQATEPSSPAAAPAAPAAPAVAEEKIPTFQEVEDEFKKLTSPEGVNMNGTAAARVLYGRALIARLFRDVPKYENLISIIPDAARPEELSPLLLATLGEILFKKGDHDKAALYFEQIRLKYPASEFGDRAPNGLAEIEFQKKNYDKALELFNEALEKYAMSEDSILTASLGKAKCYIALKKLDDADKLYTTILNTRDWRVAHPIALLGLGDISLEKKEYPKAITYYRKILLAWRKDKEILFKAYLNCAKAYVGNADNKSAREMLEEMLRQKELSEFAALQTEAEQLLAKTPAGP